MNHTNNYKSRVVNLVECNRLILGYTWLKISSIHSTAAERINLPTAGIRHVAHRTRRCPIEDSINWHVNICNLMHFDATDIDPLCCV